MPNTYKLLQTTSAGQSRILIWSCPRNFKAIIQFQFFSMFPNWLFSWNKISPKMILWVILQMFSLKFKMNEGILSCLNWPPKIKESFKKLHNYHFPFPSPFLKGPSWIFVHLSLQAFRGLKYYGILIYPLCTTN